MQQPTNISFQTQEVPLFRAYSSESDSDLKNLHFMDEYISGPRVNDFNATFKSNQTYANYENSAHISCLKSQANSGMFMGHQNYDTSEVSKMAKVFQNSTSLENDPNFLLAIQRSIAKLALLGLSGAKQMNNELVNGSLSPASNYDMSPISSTTRIPRYEERDLTDLPGSDVPSLHSLLLHMSRVDNGTKPVECYSSTIENSDLKFSPIIIRQMADAEDHFFKALRNLSVKGLQNNSIAPLQYSVSSESINNCSTITNCGQNNTNYERMENIGTSKNPEMAVEEHFEKSLAQFRINKVAIDLSCSSKIPTQEVTPISDTKAAGYTSDSVATSSINSSETSLAKSGCTFKPKKSWLAQYGWWHQQVAETNPTYFSFDVSPSSNKISNKFENIYDMRCIRYPGSSTDLTQSYDLRGENNYCGFIQDYSNIITQNSAHSSGSNGSEVSICFSASEADDHPRNYLNTNHCTPVQIMQTCRLNTSNHHSAEIMGKSQILTQIESNSSTLQRRSLKSNEWTYQKKEYDDMTEHANEMLCSTEDKRQNMNHFVSLDNDNNLNYLKQKRDTDGCLPSSPLDCADNHTLNSESYEKSRNDGIKSLSTSTLETSTIASSGFFTDSAYSLDSDIHPSLENSTNSLTYSNTFLQREKCLGTLKEGYSFRQNEHSRSLGSETEEDIRKTENLNGPVSCFWALRKRSASSINPWYTLKRSRSVMNGDATATTECFLSFDENLETDHEGRSFSHFSR